MLSFLWYLVWTMSVGASPEVTTTIASVFEPGTSVFSYETKILQEIDGSASTPITVSPKDRGADMELTVLDVGPYHIELRWKMQTFGDIATRPHYEIHYDSLKNSRNQSVSAEHQKGEFVLYNLTNLEPDTDYNIYVTLIQENIVSNKVSSRTDIRPPSAPILVNVSYVPQNTISIHWKRPSLFNKISCYFMLVRMNNQLSINRINATSEEIDTMYPLPVTSTNRTYEVQVRAGSYSNLTGRYVEGELSEAKQVWVPNETDDGLTLNTTPSELGIGVLAGVLCACFAFLIAVAAFILWRKCFRSSYYFIDDPAYPIPTASLDWNAPPESNGEYKGAIPVHQFAKHVQELHADGDIGFSKEYELIQSEATNDAHLSEHSQHPDNQAKNRYLNIIAYDHSRVQLLQFPGHKKNIDYINANYIDGFQWSKAYIGTQGPLPSTFDCFWRMVWEQRVNIIVMITNLVERGRRKCDMYWPKEGTETYGVIQVKLHKEDVMATYTVRTLLIRHLKVKKKKPAFCEKYVYQYHYTNWPDHGTPDHPLPVLHFVRKSAAANPPDAGPIIVHCSAGVGRTGTYIVLDAMLRQISTRNEANVFGFLRHIRTQRNFLVQTEEQYIFLHDALVEAIESGETNVNRDKFPKYVQVLQNNNIEEKNEHWKTLDKQFQLVTSFKCKDFNLVSANKEINQPKNRTTSILPVESSRVHLTPKPGEDGSDYINATWMQGFHSLREFIITQHPLPNTAKDFWQMIWDHSSMLVVVLSATEPGSDFDVFWPKKKETEVVADEQEEGAEATTQEEENNGVWKGMTSHKVTLVEEKHLEHYTVRDFTMQSLQDDFKNNVKMLHCHNWPHRCASFKDMYELPNAVLELGVQTGPIIVVDRFGATEAATFSALVTLKKHLLYDNNVDIYMYAKLYHNKRPGIWTSSNDYLKLHLAVQTLCGGPTTDNTSPSDFYVMYNGVANGIVPKDNPLVVLPPPSPSNTTTDIEISIDNVEPPPL